MNAIGAPTSPSTALTWRAVWRRAAFSGVAAASIRSSAMPSAPSKSAFAQERQHVVLEDRLALGVGQERRLEAGRGVELDLPVLERRVDVEEDRQAVVEPAPADAPLVDQREGARLGLLGRHAVVDELV